MLYPIQQGAVRGGEPCAHPSRRGHLRLCPKRRRAQKKRGARKRKKSLNRERNAPSKAPNRQVACPSLFWLFFQCCCDVSSGLMRVITIVQLRRQFRANASRNSKWMLRLRRQIPAAVLTKVITPLQLRRLTRAHEIGSSEKARCPQVSP